MVYCSLAGRWYFLAVAELAVSAKIEGVPQANWVDFSNFTLLQMGSPCDGY